MGVNCSGENCRESIVMEPVFPEVEKTDIFWFDGIVLALDKNNNVFVSMPFKPIHQISKPTKIFQYAYNLGDHI